MSDNHLDGTIRRTTRVVMWRQLTFAYFVTYMIYCFGLWRSPDVLPQEVEMWILIINFWIWPILAWMSRFYVAFGVISGAYIATFTGPHFPIIDQILAFAIFCGILAGLIDASLGWSASIQVDNRSHRASVE